uniref:Uncharacterized protein n=1 Tax=Fusarium oxysporum (strain Fo5176) TaxID=660025 RepID=A0A0D2YHS3_FUSOF
MPQSLLNRGIFYLQQIQTVDALPVPSSNLLQ